MVIDEMITTGHARSLIMIEDPELQYETAMKIFDQGMTVRETEVYVKKVLAHAAEKPEEKSSETEEKDLTPIYKEIEENLKNVLGTKTSVKPKSKGRGKTEIEYYSTDDMERILHLLYSIPRN